MACTFSLPTGCTTRGLTAAPCGADGVGGAFAGGPQRVGAAAAGAVAALVSAASVVQLAVDTPTDPETLRDVLFTSTCGLAWASRMVLFMKQGVRLQRLVTTLLVTRKRYAEEFPGIRNSYDRAAAVIFYAWQVLPLTAVSLWALGPVTGAPLAVASGNYTVLERREPLVMWLPVDTQRSPTYELVFAMEMVGVYAVAEISILLDIFLVCLMILVTAEVAVLNRNVSSTRLSRLDQDQPGGVTAIGREGYGGLSADGEWSAAANQTLPNSTLLPYQDTDAAKRRLYDCLKRNIQHHQTIMTRREQRTAFYYLGSLPASHKSVNLFHNLVSSLAGIRFLKYAAIKLVLRPELQMLVFGVLVTIIKTALFCLIGQSLTDNSERLLDSAFSCGWPTADRRFCSALLIFMQQASQPLSIRVGKIVTLSRNSFLQVMNVSYTIFNMLLNTQ
uniref:Odorant receptor n=1 Tax=Locusta migratoria TaxID=7004 RepID=A0A0M4JNT5_LOCMI|nr:odorant receptor 108 [Locusta migratoria]